MADVKTADKTVKHISQDATDMPEAMKGVQVPCSARLLRRVFAGLFAGLHAGGQWHLPEAQHVLHPQAHARNSKAAAEAKEDGLAA